MSLPLLLTLAAGLFVWGFLRFFGRRPGQDGPSLRRLGDQLLAVSLLVAGAGLWWPRLPAPPWGVLLTGLGVAALTLVLVYIIPYRLAEQLGISLRRPGVENVAEPQPSKGSEDSWLSW